MSLVVPRLDGMGTPTQRVRQRRAEWGTEIVRTSYWLTPLARKPPSTAMIWPVVNDEASDAR
jgi:hypothetical protein